MEESIIKDVPRMQMSVPSQGKDLIYNKISSRKHHEELNS